MLNLIENETYENENKNVKTEKTNKVLTTVFSVLGSLLLGIGLTFLLVGLWEKFPLTGRMIISFLPMLIGQGIAVFTFLKKRENVVWCEGASILWTIGVTATVGMFSNLFGIHLGVLNCLLIDALLSLPIIFLFNATIPLAFYYSAAIAGSLGITSMLSSNMWSAGSLILLMIPGYLFTYKNTRSSSDVRFQYCKWISVIASIVSTVACGFVLECESITLMIVGALFLCLYCLDKEESWASPFYLFGVAGSGIVTVGSTFSTMVSEHWDTWNKDYISAGIFGVVVAITLIIFGFIKGAESFEKNKAKTAFCVASVIGLTVNTLASVLYKNPVMTTVIALSFFTVTVVQAITLIVKGAQERKYFSMNIGLAMAISLIFFALNSYYSDPLIMGIAFMVSGTVLFIANFYITKRSKAKAELLTENTQEVQEDEK